MKSYIIPIFIPHLGCPFKCIFCDQEKITGIEKELDPEKIVKEHLATIKKKRGVEKIQIAFFGGSFTAISLEAQKKLLLSVTPFLKSGLVDSIRVSTRPDFIDDKILTFLKEYGVNTIEIGVQSLNDSVLLQTKRGYTVSAVEKAAKLIKSRDFNLGIQLMPGLPGDTEEIINESVQKTIEYCPEFVRIYPTIVIKGTKLHSKFLEKEYTPLSLTKAIEICARMYKEFKNNNIDVIRIGLHSSDSLEKKFLMAGPYHPSFGELVLSEVAYRVMLEELPATNKNEYCEFIVPHKQLSIYLGQKRRNLLKLNETVTDCLIKIVADKGLPENKLIISTAKDSYCIKHPYFH